MLQLHWWHSGKKDLQILSLGAGGFKPIIRNTNHSAIKSPAKMNTQRPIY